MTGPELDAIEQGTDVAGALLLENEWSSPADRVRWLAGHFTAEQADARAQRALTGPPPAA